MFKSFVKFALIMMVTMIITYFLAGLVARFVLGGSEFYPPSPTAISYLRDPSGPGMALIIWPAQLCCAACSLRWCYSRCASASWN